MVVVGRETAGWSMTIAGMVIVGIETARWSMLVAGMIVVGMLRLSCLSSAKSVKQTWNWIAKVAIP